MPDASRLAIGVDIGGTHTKLGLVDGLGNIRDAHHIPTHAVDDPGPYLAAVQTAVGELRARGGAAVCGIGLSVHGYVDAQRRGPIVAPNTPALCGLDLRGLFERTFDLPVVVNADLTAHTLAEYAYGSGRNAQRFLCLVIGTGLGAGVVVDGQALRYLGGCAGDTGHIILEPDGPACPMGCRGCAEALCGVAGIERLARERLGRDVAAHTIIADARAGDADAVAVVVQVGTWLGQLLASLCSIYLPNRVALCGGVSEAGPVLLAACEERFYELVGDYHKTARALSQDFYGGVEFVLGDMRSQAGIVGAVAELFLDDSAQA